MGFRVGSGELDISCVSEAERDLHLERAQREHDDGGDRQVCVAGITEEEDAENLVGQGPTAQVMNTVQAQDLSQRPPMQATTAPTPMARRKAPTAIRCLSPLSTSKTP